MSRLFFSVLVLVSSVQSFASVELFPKVYEPVSGIETVKKFNPPFSPIAFKTKVKKSLSVQFMTTAKSGRATQYVAQVTVHYVPIESWVTLRKVDQDEVIVMAGGEEKQKDGSIALVLKPLNSRFTNMRGITVTAGDHGDTNVKLQMYAGFKAVVHETPVMFDESYVVH